jgi:hypothetical protein
VPGILGQGVATFRGAIGPRMGLAVLVLAIAAAARALAQTGVDDGKILVPLLIDFFGMTVATIIALPWFRVTLNVEREADAPARALLEGLAWGPMIVGALFFWGGVFLGLRYLYGIPSVFVLIWYGLFAFAVASGEDQGLNALGASVRLGLGRRSVVAGVAVVLAILNFVALTPLGGGVNPLTIAATIGLLAVTTNVSMGAGAHLFVWLVESEGR